MFGLAKENANRARNFGSRTGLVLTAAAIAFVLYLILSAKPGIPAADGSEALSHGSIVLNSALVVLREGLEAVLVLAAVTASFVGGNRDKRRPVALGAGLAFIASVITWFVAVLLVGALGGPGLEIQAATGLIAVVVLLVVMNWFFHRVYWTGWISHHHRRRRELLASGGGKAITFGLVLLGFTAVYREGFEIVLFLQNLRLKYGTAVVMEGVGIGAVLTLIIGILTFVAHRKLPYKRMLVLTGVLIGFVLIVMVGESAQELQQAGWISTTEVGMTFPGWVGTWLAVFPTVETLGAQAIAVTAVVGSYLVAEQIRFQRPAAARQKQSKASQKQSKASESSEIHLPIGDAARVLS